MKKWLFNPFEILAGWTSLGLGICILVVTSVAAFYANVHLDGVIDLHVSDDVTFKDTLLEGLINWFCLAGFLYISGLIFSKSAIRIIDVVGTQAMARFPYLLATVVSLALYNNKVISYFEQQFLHTGEAVDLDAMDVVVFALATLITLLMMVWMIYLMYKAYSVACNLKGTKGVLSFIVALLLAEILSKILIGLIYSPVL